MSWSLQGSEPSRPNQPPAGQRPPYQLGPGFPLAQFGLRQRRMRFRRAWLARAQYEQGSLSSARSLPLYTRPTKRWV